MIRKIVSIKGIGRYEEFKASGDVDFKKYTLIFAENGVGKTTLSDIIRSLQTGNPDFILGRRTLGSQLKPETKILLTDNTVAEFRAGQWTRLPPGGVAIFDAGYVRDNVHAGEIVETGHRRNLFQVIVGQEGVTLSRAVEDLERQKGALNTPIRSAKQAIDGALPPGMRLGAYLDLEEDSEIDLRIAEEQRALAAAHSVEEIKKRRGLFPLLMPALPTEFYEVLATALGGVSEEAERLLRAHLSHLGGAQAERWVAQGLSLTHNDHCPFCKQNIAANELVSAYRVCFSEAYRTLSTRANTLTKLVAESVGDTAFSRIETLVAQNAEAAAIWGQYCTIVRLEELDLSKIKSVMTEAHAAGMALIERKSANLLEMVDLDDRMKAALIELEKLSIAVAAYNFGVMAGVTAIEACRAALDQADVSQLTTSLQQLQARKKRFEEPLRSTCEVYRNLTTEKDQLEEQKKVAKEKLDAHTARVISIYEASLNRYLDRFLVGFRIRGTKAEFPRGLPSSSYQIVINEVAVDLGNEESPHAEPSFRNTLSGGDRSALALSLFMAQLDHATQTPEIAVLLDDPFQSQDGFRRNATAFQIRRCGTSCKQVIVLSHDPQFLKLVWDELPPDQRKALRLHAVGRATTISEWNIYEHLQSAHQANLDSIQRYVDHGKGESRNVAQKLRPALEGYCKLVCYGQFGETDMMGDIIKVVRSGGEDHPLHGILDHLEEMNSYARRYHHATNPDADAEPLNEGELQGYARRIIQLMRVRPAPL